jgi:hypothetical protein
MDGCRAGTEHTGRPRRLIGDRVVGTLRDYLTDESMSASSP